MSGRLRGYAAEDHVFKRRTKPMAMRDATDLAAKLFAHFGVEPIEVRRTTRGARRGGSWYWYATSSRPPRIHLNHHAPDWIVCHEVAHYVAHQLGETGHGAWWAGVYVEAVRVAISEHYAARLHRAMVQRGLVPK